MHPPRSRRAGRGPLRCPGVHRVCPRWPRSSARRDARPISCQAPAHKAVPAVPALAPGRAWPHLCPGLGGREGGRPRAGAGGRGGGRRELQAGARAPPPLQGTLGPGLGLLPAGLALKPNSRALGTGRDRGVGGAAGARPPTYGWAKGRLSTSGLPKPGPPSSASWCWLQRTKLSLDPTF